MERTFLSDLRRLLCIGNHCWRPAINYFQPESFTCAFGSSLFSGELPNAGRLGSTKRGEVFLLLLGEKAGMRESQPYEVIYRFSPKDRFLVQTDK